MYSLILKHLIIPLGSFFFNGNYGKYLKEWKRYDTMTKEELSALQIKKLKEILEYAKDKVPFYNGLGLSQNAPITDFPILTKTILREHIEELISKDYKIEKLEKNHSSGSSGVQSVTYMTLRHKFYLRALQTHWWTWGGYTPGESLLQTGMSPKRGFVKSLKDFFFKVLYMEAFALNPKIINKAFKKIEKSKTKHIAGYPSALFELAKVAVKEGKQYKFKSLISYGDKLFDYYIKSYNKAFDNPTIINTYGCAEGLSMACQVDLPYYYIMSPHVYLEVVDEKGTIVKDGEMGHILITGLTSHGMPLIRYKLGDLGILLPQNEYPDKKLYNYPLLKTVLGRETDVIKTPIGDTLIVHSFTGIIEFFTEITQYKIVQTDKNKIIVKYITVTDNKLNDDTMNRLKLKLDNLVKNSMEVSFEKDKKIASSPSGKPQIIESKIN